MGVACPLSLWYNPFQFTDLEHLNKRRNSEVVQMLLNNSKRLDKLVLHNECGIYLVIFALIHILAAMHIPVHGVKRVVFALCFNCLATAPCQSSSLR